MGATATERRAAHREELKIDTIANLRHLARVLRWAAGQLDGQANQVVAAWPAGAATASATAEYAERS